MVSWCGSRSGQAQAYAQMRQIPGAPANFEMPHIRKVELEEGAEELVREGTAELENDPRFFMSNVIDKRLIAFEGLSIITQIMSAQAVETTFTLTAEFAWTGGFLIVSIAQLVGFFMMVTVMFLATVATAVLSLQLFFTIRLMTAGPLGFDKAAAFYSATPMWIWRRRAIGGVLASIVLFTFSSGMMLFVKFYTEGSPELERLSAQKKEAEYEGHKTIARSVLGTFIVLSAVLVRVVTLHQRCFDQAYQLGAAPNELSRVTELTRHLVSERPTERASDRSWWSGPTLPSVR